MNVDIQARHVSIEEVWRVLIDERLTKLAGRYPELLRVHVTVKHGEHHQHGTEAVDLLASLPGLTLRAAKEDADMLAALHAAFDALEREIQREHERHRHTFRSTPRGTRKASSPGHGTGHESPP